MPSNLSFSLTCYRDTAVTNNVSFIELFPCNPSFSSFIPMARSFLIVPSALALNHRNLFYWWPFSRGSTDFSFRTHLMLCCNRGMSGWRYGTHLTLLHVSCLERWERERFSKFGLWIKVKIRRREGE